MSPSNSIAYLTLILSSIVGMVACGIAEAGPLSPEATDEVSWLSEERSSLCGIYCIYAASDTLGVSVELPELIEPRFISKDYGSSTEDLVNAASFVGLKSHVIGGVSIGDLSALAVPAVLHVQSRAVSGAHDHWVLCLGEELDGRIRILDPTYGLEFMTPAHLASRFDGSAILLGTSKQQIKSTTDKMFKNRKSKAMVFGAWLVAAIVLVSSILAKFTSKFYLCSFATYAGVVALASLAFHVFAPVGFLNETENVLRHVSAHSQADFPTIGFESMLKLVQEEEPDVLLVDARYLASFRGGTIGNALNYPLDISVTEETGLIQRVLEARKVVVFCQSESCVYDKLIARRLHYYGAKNVTIYEGGINDWTRPRTGPDQVAVEGE